MRALVICGGTCSGKTTLAKKLEQDYKFKRIITYTTRKMRPGEVDGVDYHYISQDDFLLRAMQGFFAEYTTLETEEGTVYYGSAKSDYICDDETKKDRLIVLDPKGVIFVHEWFEHQNTKSFRLQYEPYIVWLDMPQEVIMRRSFSRGDKPEEVAKRIQEDHHAFIPIRFGRFFDLRVCEEKSIENLAYIVSAYYSIDRKDKVVI